MIINVEKMNISAIRNKKLKAILICLFTDAFVPEDEIPEHITENRGWFGDFIDIMVNGQKKSYSLGSKAWIFERELLTDEKVREYEEYQRQALQILLDLKVIKTMDLTVERTKEGLKFLLIIDGENITLEGIK